MIATISVMTLLVMVALAMLGLATLENRSSNASSAQAEAQANARLALMMAIGELQKQLGPDQRVSTTADQLEKPGSEGQETAAAMGSRYWTGVYDSWLSSTDDRPDPKFRRWLVSGDPNLLALSATAETELADLDSVELVGTGTIGSDGIGQVKVPAIQLTEKDKATGRMAWWIGDQGVKAALATPPPYRGSSLAVTRNNLQAAPRNAIELAATDSSRPFSDLSTDDPRLPKVTSWQQSSHLLSDPKASQPLFHDISAFSTGLLTNVRAGGFRKDLSLKMETYTSAPDLSDPNNVLYTVRSPVTGYEEVGINFQELWAYYNLYKELKYSGGRSYTTGGSIPSKAPYLQTADSLQAIAQDNWDRFKHPVTISYQNVLSFGLGPDPRDPRTSAVYVNIDPIITLWNPLDVAIDVATHRDNRNREKCYMYVFWVIPYDINVRVNGGTLRKCSLMRSVYRKDYLNPSGGIDYNMMRLNAGEKERITLKPGEVLKISQTGNTQSGNGGFAGLDGTKGFNYGGGTKFALIDENGQYVHVDSDDVISYSVSPNHLTGGRDGVSGGNIIDGFGQRNSRRWSLTHNSLVIGSPWGTNLHIGMVGVDHCYGYSRAQVGEYRTTRNPRMNKTLGNSDRVYANNPAFSEPFPVIQGPQYTRTIPIPSMYNARKAPFMVHHYSIKTEQENTRGTRMLSRFNPMARNVDFYNLSEKERDMLPYETGVIPLTSWLNAPLDESADGQGFFGSSFGTEFGSHFVNTHTVPRQPIVSLAAFQHSFANGFNRLTASISTEHAMARIPMLPHVSHAIGNSLAPSLLAPDETEGILPKPPGFRFPYPHPIADHSYLANRELWDDYFLSSIAPRPSPEFSQPKNQKTVAREFFVDEKRLLNVRYLRDLGGKDATELVNSLFSGDKPTQDAISKVASYLRVDGLFNVNSTSVEAWKAVLGTLKDRPIVVRNESGSETIAAKDGDTPVTNIEAPRNIIVEDKAAMEPAQWHGRRVLTDDEIESLAQGIVREIRKRGPFLSLADFVNRRVGNNKELARSGAVQSALDSADVNVNKNQNSGRGVAQGVTNRFEFPEAEEGAMHYGAPSMVKQGDILTPIAPILSARSDSFIIRTYGEAVDSDGKILAQAWCEAVVERQRDYLDPTDPAETATADLRKTTNKSFGRQFKLISFRWLNPREI